MLQNRSIEPGTLALLNSLMDFEPLKNFSLVGGTNLALRFGHRLSIDIDLFSHQEFDNYELANRLKEKFLQLQLGNVHNKIGLFCYINGIKVDFVRHHYFKLIGDIEEINGVRMFSLRDVAAMKIFAMLKRPKKKDHWDIAEILKYMSLEEMIDAYFQKYPDKHLLISIPRALTYTDDVDDDIDPVSLTGATWEDVKKIIAIKVDEYLK